jgi:hypothetical protein
VADATPNKLEEPIDEINVAMQRMLVLMKMEHVTLLLELLETIMGGSGYGGVEIVVSEKRIQTLKLTQSFKPIVKLSDGADW